MKVRYLVASLAVASVVLMGALGTAGAKDEWFLLAEQTIKATDPSVRISAEERKWIKEDVKDVRLSVEGADVDIKKVVLHWKNRRDETVWNVGTVKAGGQTAAKSAPGHEGTLGAVTVNYVILGGAPTAKLKVWGYD
jgi:hypothetical protein